MRRLYSWFFKPPYYGVPLLVWLYALACCLCFRRRGVFAGHLSGYDDHVRMVQILNWVNGAGWYDRIIHRVDPPDGFTTIWSRIVDIPYAVLIIALQNVVEQKYAALIASFVIPFAELGILFSAARYFARPLIGKKKARLIVLFMMFTSVLNFKGFSIAGFHTGEASHHAWYVILNLLLFGAVGRLVSGVRDRAIVLSLSAVIALLLAVGIESIPLIAGCTAMLAVIGWLYPVTRITARAAEAFLYAALFSLLLLPLHQPPERLFDISFAEPSILGPLLLLIAAVFLACTTFFVFCGKMRSFLSAASILGTAMLFASLTLLAFPDLLAGPAAALSPAERVLAFKEHAEARPLYKVALNLPDFLGLVMPTLIALVSGFIAIKVARTQRQRRLALAYFGFTALTGGMAEWISRYYHHAMTVACVWLLWGYTQIKHGLSRDSNYILKCVSVFFILGPFWMLIVPSLTQHPFPWKQTLFFPAKLQMMGDSCNVVEFSAYLNQHYKPNTWLMVPGADSSRLLYYSDINIDFLNNYPSHDRFIDNQTFFGTQDVESARLIALKHKADLVAVCHMAAGTLKPLQPGEQPMMFERLASGHPPDWLRPIATGVSGDYRLYEVNRQALQRQGQ